VQSKAAFTDSLASQLKELADLHEHSGLTDAEFQLAKKKLLG